MDLELKIDTQIYQAKYRAVDQIRYKVWNQTWMQVMPLVINKLDVKMRNQVINQVWDQTGRQILFQMINKNRQKED